MSNVVPTIRDPVQILLGCVERGRIGGIQHPLSICMVPSVLRGVSPSSFNPRMVSIGPLHRDDENMKKFEVRKDTYLHDLLDRVSSPPEHTLKAFVQKVNASLPRIKACYEDLNTYDDIEIATMMVKDCCFIIEFLYKRSCLQTSFVLCIAVDLMLLENQIPFFILQDILECTHLQSIPSAFLTRKLLQVLWLIDPFRENLSTINVGTDTTHHHILDLLHKSYHLTSITDNLNTFQQLPTHHTAFELSRAGVNFKPNHDGNWPLAMKYERTWFMSSYQPWGEHTLTMPKLYIGDYSELVLRNLIAYEQSSGQVRQYFTSYAIAMDMLVDTQEDIEKLIESEVVINDLGSNEEAAKMINSMGKEVNISEFYYIQQWNDLDSYYRAYWPNKIAWMRRTYFNSPWNAIALIAGMILFVLTVVQTVYAIKAK